MFLILITVCYSVIVKEGAWTLDDVAKDNRTRASFYPVPDTGTEISHQMYTAFRCKKCKEPIAVPADVRALVLYFGVVQGAAQEFFLLGSSQVYKFCAFVFGSLLRRALFFVPRCPEVFSV